MTECTRDNNLRVSFLGEGWSHGGAECCLALSLCPLTEEQGIHRVGSSERGPNVLLAFSIMTRAETHSPFWPPCPPIHQIQLENMVSKQVFILSVPSPFLGPHLT